MQEHQRNLSESSGQRNGSDMILPLLGSLGISVALSAFVDAETFAYYTCIYLPTYG